MRTIYGPAAELTHNGETHDSDDHHYVPWRKGPGSNVTGWYCRGCGDLQID